MDAGGGGLSLEDGSDLVGTAAAVILVMSLVVFRSSYRYMRPEAFNARSAWRWDPEARFILSKRVKKAERERLAKG